MARIFIQLSLLAWLFTPHAFAQKTVTWTGNSDGIFFDNPANWDSSPTNSDDALGFVDVLNLADEFIINSGSSVEHYNHLGAATNAWSVDVNSNSTLVLTDTTAFFGIRAATLNIESGGTVQGQFIANGVTTTIGNNGTLILHGAGNPINASTIDFTGDLSGKVVSFESTANFISEHLAKITVNGDIASITANNISITSDSSFDYDGDGAADTVTIAQGLASAPFLFGDLNGNGTIDATDWTTFRSNLFGNPVAPADPENPTATEFGMAYAAGDLDSDFDVDLSDYGLFADAYDTANGAGAFSAVIPEPTGAGLMAGLAVLFLITMRCTNGRRTAMQLALLLGCFACFNTPADADIFYTGAGADPNDIYDEANYDLTNSPLFDPGNPTADIIMEATQAELTSGAVLSINDNITIANATIDVVVNKTFGSLAIGPGFVTTLDNVTLSTNTTSGGFSNGGLSGHNGVANGGSGNGSPCFSTTRIDVTNGSNLDLQFVIGTNMAIDGTSSVSFRGAGNPVNDSVALGGVGIIMEKGAEVTFPGTNNFGSTGGAGEAPYIWAANASGELVRYADDSSILSFDATGTTATAVFDNTLGARCPIVVEVNQTTGGVQITNPNNSAAFSLEFDAYSLSSAGGSLSTAGWNSLQDQNLAGFPAGSGSGNGWEEGGQSDAFEIGEAYLTGTSTLAAQASLNLGNAYDTAVDTQDLQFTFRDGNGTLSAGAITYVTSSGLACDADGDGDCQLDDLAAMYAAEGSAGDFDFNGNGSVGPEDVDGWLAAASQSANTANPSGRVYAVGDLNFDFAVNSTDLGLLLNNFGANAGSASAGPGWGGGDVTLDGSVNSTDLGQLLNNFGFMGAATQSVPEPASALPLWICGLLLVVNMKRRSR